MSMIDKIFFSSAAILVVFLGFTSVYVIHANDREEAMCRAAGGVPLRDRGLMNTCVDPNLIVRYK